MAIHVRALPTALMIVVLVTLWAASVEAQYSLRPFNPEVCPESPETYHNDPVELPSDIDDLLEKALSLPVGSS